MFVFQGGAFSFLSSLFLLQGLFVASLFSFGADMKQRKFIVNESGVCWEEKIVLKPRNFGASSLPFLNPPDTYTPDECDTQIIFIPPYDFP